MRSPACGAGSVTGTRGGKCREQIGFCFRCLCILPLALERRGSRFLISGRRDLRWCLRSFRWVGQFRDRRELRNFRCVRRQIRIRPGLIKRAFQLCGTLACICVRAWRGVVTSRTATGETDGLSLVVALASQNARLRITAHIRLASRLIAVIDEQVLGLGRRKSIAVSRSLTECVWSFGVGRFAQAALLHAQCLA